MDPLADALAKYLPAQGLVVELASGSGERIVQLARTFGQLAWQPTERDPVKVAALVQARDASGLNNVLRPIELDVFLQPWPIAQADAIVAIEYAHTVAWDQVAAAMGGGARLLQANGVFIFFGAFRFHGRYAAKEHEDLDQALRARDPNLGLRDIRELTVAGTRTGLGLEHAVATPAGHAVVFRRRPLLPPTGQFRIS
ncbi:MAG TPA: DUF938 domain-containing protein [Kofleriaceae bacterium]|nr:DUF938 domain-containing protein [Kofleriaceae bacterium]